MVATADAVKRLHKKVCRKTREGTVVPKELTIEEIEKALGLNKVQPITLTPAEEIEMLEEGDYFRDWYEEELRKLYDRQTKTSS